MFHVTSARNRQSIETFGLDPARMGAARGIAGSRRPEQESEEGADWFIQMNNTGGPVDLWAVANVDREALVESPEGYLFVPGTIEPHRLTLLRADIPPVRRRRASSSSNAVRSSPAQPEAR